MLRVFEEGGYVLSPIVHTLEGIKLSCLRTRNLTDIMRAAGQFGTNRGPITVKVTRKADSHELDQSDMIWNVFMGLNRVGFSSCRW